MYVADLGNDVIYVINRQNLTELSRFGGGGRQAGEFHWPHMVAVDSEGNVYVGEVDGAARAQKFLRYGADGLQRHRQSGSGQVPPINRQLATSQIVMVGLGRVPLVVRRGQRGGFSNQL